jgi:membrane associated rhomboid family serine protease
MMKLWIASAIYALASAAYAAASIPVSEPGTFELLALGGVVAGVVALRRRRKWNDTRRQR